MTEPLSGWSTTRIESHLRQRGIWSGPAPQVRTLAGGVSGTVLRLDGPDRSLVLKQALAELNVPAVWQADPRRILTEADALRTLHRISADHAPAVLDCDRDELLLAMQAAPEAWHTWKEQLLAGQPASEAEQVARSLGHQVRLWHQATTAAEWPTGAPDRQRFAPTADFTALRLDPFYRHVADQHGGRIAERLHQLADGLLTAQTCLVHGDLSPKNILRPAGPGTEWWLVDSECAVLGDPVFDVAFLLTHLLLKSLDPERTELRTAAQEFWRAYCQPAAPQTPRPGAPRTGASRARAAVHEPLPEVHLVAHCAALMLARVDGVSKVGYLTAAQVELVRRQATRALLEETDSLTGYLDLIGTDGSTG
ncbi:phosphotransferase family protein [Ruania zhangjianzhongii]|uniref:phosphotransferase family protein n=1 Tax=Ruania zhangjianzhongii TaxID=2603206 RepID=UPI0011CBD245|nr:aminoglycoside phosphotransferase family protein [Ruania zhangjianzhongii]